MCYTTSMDTNFRFNYMRYENPTQSDYYSHMHNDYELFYFLDGDADYIIGSNVYHLERYDLLLIKPSTYHHLHLLSSAPYERMHFNFTSNEVVPDVIAFLESGDTAPIYHVPKENPLHRYFEDLLQNRSVFSETEFSYFKHAALNLILLHLKHTAPHTPTRSAKSSAFENNEVLKNLIQYIDDNADKELTIGDLATKFFVSPSWIVHHFKKTLNISVTQYINRRRITFAQRLIHSGISAYKAAELCEYSNYTTFFRQYKKYLGRSPLDDRTQKGPAFTEDETM